MNKLIFYVLIVCALIGILFASCLTEHPAFVLSPLPEEHEDIHAPRVFVVTDHKNANAAIPEWANRFYEGGFSEVISMEAGLDSFMFIARSQGNNFDALRLWHDGFNLELDFPRMAAARAEARFSAGIHFPDHEYGDLYVNAIRAISDTHWTGMSKEDDFWARRRFPDEDEEAEREDWEFMILVTIGKANFAGQLTSIFQGLKSGPQPSERQVLAFNRVVENFFEGF